MLELKNISYSVDVEDSKGTKKKDILKNINLTIEDGKFIVITGPNGSGKSTLAKIIMGIIKPTSGNIFFDGKEITNYSIDERAKAGIAFAFQQPTKFKGLTVKDLISLASNSKIEISDACEYLSNVGLCARDYIDRQIDSSLSGGELKRIEIAVNEARKARLSIFDEPEAGIDLWSFGNLIKVFDRIQKKSNKNSNLIISHQERLIEIADSAILLVEGKIKKIGKPQEIMQLVGASYGNCTKITGDK